MGENKEFSVWLKSAKAAMIDKGLKISDVAKAVETTDNYLYGIMSGRVFSQPMIQKVSDYLGIAAVEKPEKKDLSAWCKAAKTEMLNRGITTIKLAEDIGMKREYVSSIINGRVHSAPAIRAISDYLNIACDTH